MRQIVPFFCFFFVAPLAADDTWQQWRGPQRDGHVKGENWPADLKGLEQLWRVELGPSYSGPIVAADRVFTTETVGEKEEVVSAFERSTGKLIWQKRWSGSIKVPFFAAANGSWIRSTPAYDGETLFVGGMREVLVALDGQTGAERWRIDFPGQMGREAPPFGFVCSPLVVGDFVYVEAAGTLRKLDKKTGREIWRSSPFTSEDMMDAGSFSSPILATLAGREQLLVQTRLELKGVDPESGKVLWSQEIPHFRGMNILTPTVIGDRVFTSSYRNASYAFDVVAAETGVAVKKAWESKAQGYMSSPLALDDTIYLHLGNGRLTALDVATGKELWTSESFGKYWSLAAQGKKILALDSNGELLLLEADRGAFRLLDRREIAQAETWAHLAPAGDQLFVRELKALVAYRLKPQTP
jgi:outer membrane protein assembly factor BamB